MAIKATVFKASLQIADMDRHYYADHALTLARHPSETDERMMVRLLAFALYADEALTFGKGLSSDDEPDLWQKDLTGAIERWIEVGLPDERVLRKASGRASRVVVVIYGRPADIWWNENRSKLQQLDKLTVLKLNSETTLALAALASRTMQLQCTIQEGHIMMTSDAGMIEIEPEVLHGDFRPAHA
ncbi:MAG: YaeQ family protein [Nitrosomonadales bacterium]|nr:YaeQ family protein [Nitrosomonadales bacterium]